jgi:hypothetical protein
MIFCSPACRQKAYRARGGQASGTTGAHADAMHDIPRPTTSKHPATRLAEHVCCDHRQNPPIVLRCMAGAGGRLVVVMTNAPR